MEGQFKSVVESMYLADELKLKDEPWKIGICFGVIEDPLEDYYTKRYFFLTPLDRRQKVETFNDILRDAHRARTSEVNCNKTQLSFVILKQYGFIRKPESIFRYLEIKDMQKAIFNPFSLQHIAAARSIPMLKHYGSSVLIGIYNATKNQDLYIRAGEMMERTHFKFANIVKHHIYKQTYGPLATLQFFENLELNPTPFCIACGLILKTYGHHCSCRACRLLREALQFTSFVERPFHTTYHFNRFGCRIRRSK